MINEQKYQQEKSKIIKKGLSSDKIMKIREVEKKIRKVEMKIREVEKNIGVVEKKIREVEKKI